MTKFRSIIISGILTLMTTCAQGASVGGDDSDIELTLLTDRSTFMVNEPVLIDILFINHGTDTVWVPQEEPSHGRVRLFVVSKGVDSLFYYRSLILDAEIPTEPFLAPHDTAYALFFLVGNASSANSNPPFDLDPLKGEIDVTAFYFKHSVSNTLSIRIAHPPSDEGDAVESSRLTGEDRPLQDVIELLRSLLYGDGVPPERETAVRRHRVFDDGISDLGLHLTLQEDYPLSADIWSRIAVYLGSSTGKARDAKLESLMTPDKPFRLRMIARNIKRRL
jgi:hypothetical protein